MKTIVSLSLVLIITLGAITSPLKGEGSKTNIPGHSFSIEVLDISPEYTAGENERIEMTSSFIAKPKDASDELFGSFWARFDVEEGSSSEVYRPINWTLEDIRMAVDLTIEEEQQMMEAIRNELEQLDYEIPRRTIEGLQGASQSTPDGGFNNEAPPIIYTNLPASLIIIDGDPFYEDLDKRYSKIVNAGAFIVIDNKEVIYYMYGGGLWFSSEDALSGWEYMEKAPKRIERLMKKHASELYDSMNDEQYQARIIPEIIISTEPAELISTDGNPKYVLIENTRLHYVENTDAELFRDLNTKKFYTLFSGRWFTSERLAGDWRYVQPSELPSDFARIPENHMKSNVLVSVPGTRAALDAVRDARIPYVTKKDISSTSDTKVMYSGEPDFVGIEGTELRYAVNTSNQVLLWNGTYYLVDEAIWYFSSSPHGPWQIATYRPEGVADIPAGNPMYNIKYVHVYKNTDRVVYTGFTSGYTGSYVYGPTVVFGTGFHYHGWYGSFYYHHPMTYGYGFFYDPFYGWAPVYSPWFRPSFYWHWHWRFCYWHRPPYYRPPHHRPPRIEHYSAARPVVRPDRPAVRPEQPIARPEQPVSRPDRPSVQPSQPSVQPSQPSVRPGQPSVQPSQPSVRPGQPTVRPSQPSVRPSQPSVRPSPPVSRPSPPSVRPSAPVSRPAPGPSRMR